MGVERSTGYIERWMRWTVRLPGTDCCCNVRRAFRSTVENSRTEVGGRAGLRPAQGSYRDVRGANIRKGSLFLHPAAKAGSHRRRGWVGGAASVPCSRGGDPGFWGRAILSELRLGKRARGVVAPEAGRSRTRVARFTPRVRTGPLRSVVGGRRFRQHTVRAGDPRSGRAGSCVDVNGVRRVRGAKVETGPGHGARSRSAFGVRDSSGGGDVDGTGGRRGRGEPAI